MFNLYKKLTIRSQALKFEDFSTPWYKRWAKELKQTSKDVSNPVHNKHWQNAAIIQALYERGYVAEGRTAVGFGVGMERVPSLLAKYGVRVTATDQDPTNKRAIVWDNGQLAQSVDSLNKYGICTDEDFYKNVTYRQNDMNNIKKSLFGKFDIVWSNCALGHLGSIDNGLDFIEKSLKCLKQDGIAVHTTEINILSDKETLDSGGTVIFRLKDLYGLFLRLEANGYTCEPLILNLGTTPHDKTVSFEPFSDDNLLKICVLGHVLTQVILVIRKAPANNSGLTLSLRKILLLKDYAVNTFRLKKFYYNNRTLRNYSYFQKAKTNITDLVKPVKAKYSIKGARNSNITIRLKYENFSKEHFFGMHHVLNDNNKLLLATDEPVNRASEFSTPEWFIHNRPRADFSRVLAPENTDLHCLVPGGIIEYDLDLRLPNKRGLYTEVYCLVLEGVGKLPNTAISVDINVS